MAVLSGYRVLDFGRYIAGPYCATLLADFGADVIRIEKVSGSEDRYVMPVGGETVAEIVGGMFLQTGRNKRGMTLNPIKPEGREVMRRLVETADVVVANMPAPGMRAMGVDYESLKAIKSDIILTTVSTFGSEGPYSDRVGFDGLGQVMSGGTHLSGSPDEPMRDALPVVDFGTAMASAYGTLAALLHREKTGEGQVVEGALLRTAMTYSSSYLIEQAMTGVNRVATGNRSQIAGPADVVPTRDGWIMVQVVGQPLFERWAKMVGRSDLLEDARYANDERRGENGEDLSKIAREHAAVLTTAEALAAYEAASVPAGEVYTPQKVLDDPHVNQAGFLHDIDYEGLKPAPLIKAPVSLSATPAAIETAAPKLGQHTDQILESLGYRQDDIERFRKLRVV